MKLFFFFALVIGMAAAQDTNSTFLGTYEPDGTCVPSATCCCVVDTLTITAPPALEPGWEDLPLPENPVERAIALANNKTRFENPIESLIFISTTVDGGEGCQFLTALGGIFIKSPEGDLATLTMLGENLTASRSEDGTVTFSSTLSDCNNTLAVAEDPPEPPSDLVLGFLGLYQPDPNCVPGDECCCAVAPMNVTVVDDEISPPETDLEGGGETVANAIYEARLAVRASGNTLVTLTGQVDGGPGCFGISKIAAEFTILNETTAFFEVLGYNFTAFVNSNATNTSATNVTTDEGANATTVLEFSNTFTPECINMMPLGETPEDPITEPNATTPVPTNATTPPILPEGSGNASLFAGDWEMDDSCVPSQRCCCGIGPLQIDINGTSLVAMTGNVDGGLACLHFQQVSGACSVMTDDMALCVADVLSLNVTRSEDGQELTLVNSVYGDSCTTRARRRLNATDIIDEIGAGSRTAPVSKSALFGGVIALAVALLAKAQLGV